MSASQFAERQLAVSQSGRSQQNSAPSALTRAPPTILANNKAMARLTKRDVNTSHNPDGRTHQQKRDVTIHCACACVWHDNMHVNVFG